jgi:hypothetical protein
MRKAYIAYTLHQFLALPRDLSIWGKRLHRLHRPLYSLFVLGGSNMKSAYTAYTKPPPETICGKRPTPPTPHASTRR